MLAKCTLYFLHFDTKKDAESDTLKAIIGYLQDFIKKETFLLFLSAKTSLLILNTAY